jgi:tetraacyldisaccharide 4'-kinase
MSRGAWSGVEESWERDGALAKGLAPLSWIFGAGVALRNRLYDAGILGSQSLGLPAVSVGNLSVGGTGKTPMSAWVAERLLELGKRPAVLLRGYGGGDEVLVHARLVPGALRVADPDRVRGAARARAEGAEVLILDDAFQHRRAQRDLDLVLVAA